MKDHVFNTEIFFDGEIIPLHEAGAKFVKLIIEKEIPKLEEYDGIFDPYIWIAEKMGKSVISVRKWTYPWNHVSGAAPKVEALLYLIKLTGHPLAMEFMMGLMKEENSLSREYNNVFAKCAEELDKLSDKFKDAAKKKGGVNSQNKSGDFYTIPTG